MGKHDKEFKERLKALSGERFRTFSPEQLAGIAVAFLQEVASGRLRPATAADHSLSALLGYWIAPLWCGRDMLDGFSHEGGMCSSIGALDAPQELDRRFEDAVELLFRHRLIRHMAGQDSDDLIELTSTGAAVPVFVNFEIGISRPADEIIDRMRESVFHIIRVNGPNDEEGGTAFLVAGGHVATCAHCIGIGRFKLSVGDTELDERHFEVKRHGTRDLALLTVKSTGIARLLGTLRYFRLEDRDNSLRGGEQVISFGYPHLPRMHTRLVPEVGTFRAYVNAWKEGEFLAFTNSSGGGCSGGPVVDDHESLVGVMSDLASQESDTDAGGAPLRFSGCATPAKHLAEMLTECMDITKPIPYQRCPKCGSTQLRWSERDEFDNDGDNWYRVQVPIVNCSECGWEIDCWD